MFLAIIIPPARKQLSVLIVVIISAMISIFFRYMIPSMSAGFAVIICAVAASVAGAILFPVKDEEEKE
jgi:FtsH-binding integral membrane protein